ncbi:MAG: hypothetical protein MRY83_08420 [Flavobacteriales bacterium]|nr:hypothetical protein [Flavobacteriales bacterium]
MKIHIQLLTILIPLSITGQNFSKNTHYYQSEDNEDFRFVIRPDSSFAFNFGRNSSVIGGGSFGYWYKSGKTIFFSSKFQQEVVVEESFQDSIENGYIIIQPLDSLSHYPWFKKCVIVNGKEHSYQCSSGSSTERQNNGFHIAENQIDSIMIFERHEKLRLQSNAIRILLKYKRKNPNTNHFLIKANWAGTPWYVYMNNQPVQIIDKKTLFIDKYGVFHLTEVRKDHNNKGFRLPYSLQKILKTTKNLADSRKH